METLAHSESFYIFASIALIVVSLFTVLFISGLVFVVIKINKIITIIESQVDKISGDIDDVRDSVKEKSGRFGGILQALIGAFVVKKATNKSRKSKK
jgi:diacylglycerol kinase